MGNEQLTLFGGDILLFLIGIYLTMVNLLDSVSKLKEGLLAIIAIDYGIGLISWNIYSWTESLGVNSAFELQYFIAGLPPLLIGGFLYWYWKTGRARIALLRKKIRRKAKGRYKVLRIVVIQGILLSYALLLVGAVFDANDSATLLTIFLIIVSLSGMFFPEDSMIVFMRRARKFAARRRHITSSRSVGSALNGFFSFYSIALTVLLIPVYYFLVYPNIPQELGGVKPKYCVFTSSRKEFFENRRMQPLRGKDSAGEAFVSRNVMVYFYNDSKLILKTNAYDENVYEIDRKDTDMIIWKD